MLDNVKLSLYQSLTKNNYTTITLADLANMISGKLTNRPTEKNPLGDYSQHCTWYTTLVKSDTQRAKQYKAFRLPAYCPTGVYSRATKQRRMLSPSGLIWIDFDDAEDKATNIREALGKLPNCVLSYISVSGKGVHLVLVTQHNLSDPDLYGRLWDSAVRTFIPDEYKQYIDPASRRLAQLAIVSYDTGAIVNLDPEIPDIKLAPPRKEPPIREVHEKIKLPRTARLSTADHAKKQLSIYSLLDRTRPPEDYPTWLRMLASLKAGGVAEGAANSWSARGSNYHQRAFHRAWKSLSSNGGITVGTFIWWATSQRR